MIARTILPFLFLVKTQEVSIFEVRSLSLSLFVNSKSGTFVVLSSFCYNVHCSLVLPVQKLGNLQPAATEANKLYMLRLYFPRGGFFRGRGWSRVVSRTKPSLHPSASRIYRKLKEA